MANDAVLFSKFIYRINPYTTGEPLMEDVEKFKYLSSRFIPSG